MHGIKINFIASLTLFMFSVCSICYAEQCTQGVHEILPWTHKITGNACEWPKNAKKLGFKVNHTPKDNAVLAFPPDYGHGIDQQYGHVAVLREIDKRKGFLIQDSNGIAGGDRATKWIKSIDFEKVEVIHQK